MRGDADRRSTRTHAETVTLSIGVAVAEPTQDTRDFKLLAERLMAEADAALYRVEERGPQSRRRFAAISSV